MTTTKLDRRQLLAIGAAVPLAFALGAREARAAGDPMSKEAVLFDPEVPVLGNPDGDVTIVEFFDYQCPYCKKSHPDVVRVVREDGRVRHVMKDWPIFGPESLYAARLTLAAGRGHAKAQAALMATAGRLTAAMIDETLAGAGFDAKALDAAYGRDAARIDAILQRNGFQAEGFNFMGTPAYVIGTVLIPGVIHPEDMKRAVDQARS